MVKSSRWRRRRGSATEVRAHALDRGPLALGEHAVGHGPNVIDLDAREALVLFVGIALLRAVNYSR